MKHKNQLKFLAILQILMVLFSQPIRAKLTIPDVSRHPIDTPTHNANPFNWQTLTAADIIDFRYELLPFGKKGGLNPANKLLTTRLNYWIERIHNGWQEKLPSVVPRPTLVLVNSNEPGAWVTWVPVCLHANVEIAVTGVPVLTAKNGAIFESEVISQLEPPVTFGAPVRRLCIESENSTQVKEFVDSYNQKNGGCELVLIPAAGTDSSTQQATIIVKERTGAKERCLSRNGEKINFNKAKQAAFRASAATIMVSTALIAEMNEEEQMLAVISHELAHYYRAHTAFAFAGANSPYNYFYQQTREPTEGTPKRFALENPAINRDVESEFQSLIKNQPLRMNVEAQKFNGRLTHFLIDDLVTQLGLYCKSSHCAQICLNTIKEANGRFGTNFLTTSMRKEERQKYIEYEKNLSACADKVKLTSSKGQKLLSTLAIALKKRNPWIGDLEIKAKTLQEFLTKADAEATKRDTQLAVFINKVKTLHLGFYTDEQEADQYAAEILSRIGIDPSKLAELHLLQGLRRQEKYGLHDWLQYHEMDMTKCKELYDNHWLDSENNYVFVPLGDLSVPHRGNCYRVFDTDREIKAHSSKYEELIEAANPKFVFSELWEDVRKEAEALTKANGL